MDGQSRAMDPGDSDRDIIAQLNSRDEEERKNGIAQLDKSYRYKIANFIRRGSLSIPSADLGILWNQVLNNVWEMTKASVIGPNPPLYSLLKVLAARASGGLLSPVVCEAKDALAHRERTGRQHRIEQS